MSKKIQVTGTKAMLNKLVKASIGLKVEFTAETHRIKSYPFVTLEVKKNVVSAHISINRISYQCIKQTNYGYEETVTQDVSSIGDLLADIS